MKLNHFKRGGLILTLIALLTIGTSFWWVLENRNNRAIERADCAVVFGAAVWKGNQPSHALADRTVAGMHLLEKNQVDCLVFSGADTEPDVMAKMAKNSGLDMEKIELDAAGESTLATLQNLSPERSYILVSNDFHLGRIRMLAWKSDLKAVTHAAPYQHGRYLKENYFIFREILGTLWYFLRFDI